jgi:hypothetical protein
MSPGGKYLVVFQDVRYPHSDGRSTIGAVASDAQKRFITRSISQHKFGKLSVLENRFVKRAIFLVRWSAAKLGLRAAA